MDTLILPADATHLHVLECGTCDERVLCQVEDMSAPVLSVTPMWACCGCFT